MLTINSRRWGYIMTTNLPTIDRIKQRAKELKKEHEITHSEALKRISASFGFKDWSSFQKELKKKEQSNDLISSVDTMPSGNGHVVIVSVKDKSGNILVEKIYPDEALKKQITDNKKQLTKIGAEFSIFEPTVTGLKKAILDATQPVRTHFELEYFHFYYDQAQGPESKVQKEAYFLTDEAITKSTISLYRPQTKKGDPRMWFRGLPNFAKPGDKIAIVLKEGTPHLINLSTTHLKDSLNKERSNIKDFLASFIVLENKIADELLSKIKILAKTPFPALRQGDTAIGYTLETMLGIVANSSKEPDYHGIEIKSGRGGKTRTTLFAQVADWEKSPCKKSAEILDRYGYEREDDSKLYCTISTQRENTQGLSFIYDQSKDELQEWHNKKTLVAVWPGDLLRKRLKEKHAETFWIEAKSELVDGVEFFQLLAVTHTKSPILSQLLPLLESGVITMDHLIKKNAKGRVSEKGPLFKINKRDLDLLFPESTMHQLV